MQYEIIEYNENLPFRIFMMDAENREYHLHKELELVFVLKGSVTYEVKNKKNKISEKDLFLVNSLDIHSVSSEKGENILLVLQLDPSFFNQYCPEFSSFYYDPNGALRDYSSSLHDKITSNLAKIMLTLVKSNVGYKLEAVHSAIDIALTLFQTCRTELRQQNYGEQHKQKRIAELLKYIDENYSSKIGLDTLSKEMLISSRYISTFFKNNLGIGFVDYINKLRITKSLNDLLGSKKSILDIAIDHGFNDHKAYNRVFKQELGMTATEYRMIASKSIPAEEHQRKNNYFNDPSRDYFKYLFEFLQKHQGDLAHTSKIKDKLTIKADLTKPSEKSLHKYWKKITCVERAALCLRSDIQSQIRMAQKDIGYEFIKFHGIFSEEMMVYRENATGNPIYKWHYIDEIIDFFYSVNLKPFIEIGFMPESLASKKQYSPEFWRPNVSFPKSIKKWSNLIYEFTRHCIERYGEAEVEKWYFEIWPAPELSNIFWYESKERFFELYIESYRAIKKASSKLSVGSPGVLPHNNFQWFKDFLHYCKDHNIKIDFAACHIYNMADPQNKTIPSELLSNERITLPVSDENYLQNSIVSIRNTLAAADLKEVDIFVTEWNLSPYTVDYTRDTCFLSSYIVYNILRNMDQVKGLAYWSLSDIMDQGITEDSIFHGGFGLLTRNSIKKPAYNAFYLLDKLGKNIIEQGNDYVISSNGGGSYQILLYNFVYFDELFRAGDKSLLSYHERYNIYKSATEKDIHIVAQLDKGSYKIKRYRLDRDSGSTYDAWLKMGAPEDISSDMHIYLKSKEILQINVSEESLKGQLILNDIIPVHGVLMIIIDKIG